MLGVDQDVQQRLLQQRADRTSTGGRLLALLAHDLDAVRARAWRSRLASTRVRMRSICIGGARIRCEPVNTSRFLHDLRGAIRLLDRSAAARVGTGFGRRGHVDQQLEMPEHALQRVVHLVRDAGDELPERRQLLGLRQARAQRGALGLEPRLPRDVARDEHAPDRLRRPG